MLNTFSSSSFIFRMFLFYLCKFSLVMNKLVIYLHTLKPSVCIFYVFLAVLPRAVPRWVEMTFNTLSIYVVFFTRMQRFSLDLLLRGGPSLSFYLITHNPSDLRERERERWLWNLVLGWAQMCRRSW